MKQLTEQIEISKEGIKVSYYRYIAESSVGLLFCGYCFVLKYWADGSEELSVWEQTFFERTPLEFTIGLFILSLLVAPAIGVLISGMAYFTLSWIEVFLLRYLYRVFVWATPMIQYSNDVKSMVASLGITPSTFVSEGYALQRILEYQGSSRIRINTRRTLTRNFTMLIILCYILALVAGAWPLLGGWNSVLGLSISLVTLSLLATLDLYLQLVFVCVVAQNSIEATRSDWHGDVSKVRAALSKVVPISGKA